MVNGSDGNSNFAEVEDASSINLAASDNGSSTSGSSNINRFDSGNGYSAGYGNI